MPFAPGTLLDPARRAATLNRAGRARGLVDDDREFQRFDFAPGGAATWKSSAAARSDPTCWQQGEAANPILSIPRRWRWRVSNAARTCRSGGRLGARFDICARYIEEPGMSPLRERINGVGATSAGAM